MTHAILRDRRTFAIQNGLAALVFALLLAAEALAYLLHSFPGVELLWRLTIVSNRLMGGLLGALDGRISTPFAVLGLLAAGVVVPLLAWRHHNWLGTAISGHVALAAVVLLTWGVLKRNNTGHAMASLGDVLDPRLFDTSVMSFAILGLVMLVLCGLNHATFFFGHGKAES